METGTKVMPRGELGEIVARGSQIIKEYWHNPEETAATKAVGKVDKKALQARG